MHCCFISYFAWILLWLGLVWGFASSVCLFFFFFQYNLVVKIVFPHFNLFYFSSGLFWCLLSGTPECHLLTSKPFNEIILKFLSAKSLSILVPLTPSAFFTVTTDSPSVFWFFLIPLIELPGFYIKLLNEIPFL